MTAGLWREGCTAAAWGAPSCGQPQTETHSPPPTPPHHPSPGALSPLPSSALGAAGAALPLPALPDRLGRVTKSSERGSGRPSTEQKEADAGEQMEPLEQDRPPPAQSTSPAILDPAPSPSRGRELGQTLLQPSWEPGWSWDRRGGHPRKGDRWTDVWMEHMDPLPQLPPCALTAQGYSRIRPPRHPGVLPRAQGAARTQGKVWRQTLTALLPCLTPTAPSSLRASVSSRFLPSYSHHNRSSPLCSSSGIAHPARHQNPSELRHQRAG